MVRTMLGLRPMEISCLNLAVENKTTNPEEYGNKRKL